MDKNSIQQIKWLFTLILASAILLISQPVHAQTIKVTINMENATMDSVMNEIEKQTQHLFITNDVNVDREVSVNVNDASLEEALKQMVQGTDIAYQMRGANIFLSKKDDIPTSRTIQGVVKDSHGQAIIGASVVIVGTTSGGTTGIAGEFGFVISTAVENPLLSVNYLGYEPQTISVGTRSYFDIVLRESAVEIANVVVTALGIKREEKALSYNVQQVASESIVANKDANFINALNGKVAGVNINASSAGVGGASKVIMRGMKSISQSSNALYVIDGVPMLTRAGEGSTEFGSQGTTDPIADINPEDIESISVLTGAAAAALYGSDAANGAIVVTTKKGQSGRVSVTATSSFEVMTPFVLPEFQNRYGTGDLNAAIGSEVRSWGRPLNKSNNMGYDPAKDYFRTGTINTESVSLSVGSERSQTYLSGAAINSRGVVPNNRYDRYNFTFRNTTSFLRDKMTLDVGANYILQEDSNMINQGTYNNPLVGAYIFPRGNDWEDIQMYERYDPVRRLYTQYWPVGDAGMTMQNPYWINYRNLRENRKDRYMLNAALSYDILKWLNVSGRIRMDNSHNDYTEKAYATTNKQLTEQSNHGLYGITTSKDRQIYGDALVNINKSFGSDWNIVANIGASFSDIKSNATRVRGPIADGVITDEKPGLANVFNIQNLSNTAKTSRLQEGWREQMQSVFGSAELGYKGTYYLTVTGRNDWPSQLAGPHSVNSSFFYPSVGASVILSQLLPRMENLSFLKLRASYASVGGAFGRGLAYPLYSWNSSSLGWNTQTQYPVFDLKPERTNSVEVGVQMRFLRNFNLDVTYYTTNTYDQTFNPQISTGSGSSNILIQSGNIRNRGFELALGYRNRWGKFTWDSNYTMSMNRNKIMKLADNITNPATGETFSVELLDMGGLGQAHFLLMEGGTMGDLYSMIDLKYDDNGKIYINEEGKIPTQTIKDVNQYVKLGSIFPKANLSWRNDFTFGDFNFGFMISARIGGVVFSRTQAVLDYYGVSEASAAARDAGGVYINGGDLVDANMWYSSIAGGTAIPQYYTYSATNVRLQEASIGYTIPSKALKDVCQISVSIVGRNLWMIYNKAPFDPESIATTGNYYHGIDYFMMPSLRNIGFNLRLKF